MVGVGCRNGAGLVLTQFQEQVFVFLNGMEINVAAVRDDPIGTRSLESGVGSGSSQGERARARGFAGLNSSRGVFDYDAGGGRGCDTLSSAQIGFRVRLSVLNVAGGDQVFWNGEAGCSKADNCERVACRGNDGKAIVGKRVKELFGTRECDDVLHILDLGFFDNLILGGMVGGG
jgi:hypothetical protein